MTRCTKIRYPTKLAAKIGLANTHRRKDDWKREETRTYFCPGCKGWHLTSKPKRSKRPPQVA